MQAAKHLSHGHPEDNNVLKNVMTTTVRPQALTRHDDNAQFTKTLLQYKQKRKPSADC
jgi:hypothetical protein